MQKVSPALERLMRAVDLLVGEHGKLADAGRDVIGKLAELDALNVECAHLRSEVSALKKKNKQLEGSQQRAAQQVEKAMRQIDDVLEGG